MLGLKTVETIKPEPNFKKLKTQGEVQPVKVPGWLKCL